MKREALSVVFGCERFKNFLLGSQFTIRNDHQPLRKLFAYDTGIPTTCSACIQRWALKLAQFNYRIEYSRGKDNVHNDCFSRLPLSDTVRDSEPYELLFTVNSLDDMLSTCFDIRQHTDQDPDMTLLKQFIKHGAPLRLINHDYLKLRI